MHVLETLFLIAYSHSQTAQHRERERRVHNVSSVHIIPRDDENMRQSLVERKKFNFHCGFHHVNGSSNHC